MISVGKINLSELIAKPFHEIYADMKRHDHVHYMMGGGRGSTKSSFIGLKIPMGIMEDPDANAIIYRKVGNTLHDSVYAQIVWAINKLGVAAYFKLKKSPMEIIYIPTGQKIVFHGADDANKSKSIKLAKGYFKYLWFEELTEFTGMDEIRTITQSVIRGGAAAVVFYSYNPPKSAQNWVNAESLIVRNDRLTHHSTYLDVPPEWLGKTFIAEAEELKRINERAYNHAYLGEVTGTGGQIFDNVRVRIITDDEHKQFDKLYHGLDFGFTIDPSAYLKMYFHKSERKLYILDEFYSVSASFDKIAEEVRKRNLHNELITADSAEPRSISELKQRGLHITGAVKGPGSVEHGIRWLQDLSEIIIDPAKCPNTAREFSGYEYDQDGHGNFKATYPDKNNHSVDSCRYGLESIIGKRTAKIRNINGTGL